MGEEFTENLFQSIDTIVKARLASLPYDKTIECEVVNADESFDKKYIVNYQASNFTAFSLGPTYKVGDLVYVSVPLGDYTQDKFIINKKYEEESTVVKKLPFLTFTKNNNLSSPALQNREFYLETNGNQEKENTNIYTYTNFYGENYAAGYTRLGLKIGIKVGINSDMISGEYGVKLIVKGFDQTTTYLPIDESDQILEEREFVLSMSDMISPNYYNTLGYCNQEKVFNIENFIIKSITVNIFHDGNFIRKDGRAVNKLRIYFNNLSVFLGYDSSEFDTTLKRSFIYTNAGFKYDNDYYIKPIYVRFVEAVNNKLNLNILTETLTDDNYKIFWETYNPIIKTRGPQSDITSFESFSEGEIYHNIVFEDGQTRLRYSFIVVIKDIFNNKYISNRLDFVRDTYFNETELLDLLTSFFRIDDNGLIYLNGGANTNKEGLNLANIILNDIYLAKNSRFHLRDNFSILDKDDNVLIEINSNQIKINIPIVQNS